MHAKHDVHESYLRDMKNNWRKDEEKFTEGWAELAEQEMAKGNMKGEYEATKKVFGERCKLLAPINDKTKGQLLGQEALRDWLSIFKNYWADHPHKNLQLQHQQGQIYTSYLTKKRLSRPYEN